MPSKFLVIGTAGHIDHGKTSLVKALTGTDTDRWEEEKRRGMTIDLGFAKLELPSGVKAGIVDVPGHEKFIKNMLAGAHGVDLVMLIVAADEGVMPQTKEHLTVCQTLGTKKGVVVITKKDLVEPEWLQLVEEEVKEFVKGTFLEGAPVVAVSSKTGEGIDELLKTLDRLAQEVPQRSSEGILRLPIDRSFTVKGFGTVITGTLLSGKVKVGDEVEILPQGKRSKVRGVQVHGESVEEALAGQRTAVNLSGVSKEEVGRGDLLATPGYLKPTKVLDAKLTLSKDADVIVTSGHKVHFHHLTAETEGEVFLIDRDELLPGETALAQIRLRDEVVPVYADRFVLRNYSPTRVIGGGEVLNPLPKRKFRRKFREEWQEKLKPFLEGDREKIVLSLVKERQGELSPEELLQFTALTPKELQELLNRLYREGKLLLSEGKLYPADYGERLKEAVVEEIKKFHEEWPILEGVSKEAVRGKLKAPKELFEKVLNRLIEEGKLQEANGLLKLKGFEPKEEGRWKEAVERLKKEVDEGGFSPPSVKEAAKKVGLGEEEAYAVASYLKNRKGYKRFGDFLLSPESYGKIVEILKKHFSQKEELSVGEFKDYLGVSRKFAIPLLEFLDSQGLTERKGNSRVKGEAL
jgi:selenocysteine-specific elongation factor